MTFRSKPIVLVIPRVDGLLVTIDGTGSLKPMGYQDYIHLAADCLKAANEIINEEKRDGGNQQRLDGAAPDS